MHPSVLHTPFSHTARARAKFECAHAHVCLCTYACVQVLHYVHMHILFVAPARLHAATCIHAVALSYDSFIKFVMWRHAVMRCTWLRSTWLHVCTCMYHMVAHVQIAHVQMHAPLADTCGKKGVAPQGFYWFS